jgi:hypothetical protein
MADVYDFSSTYAGCLGIFKELKNHTCHRPIYRRHIHTGKCGQSAPGSDIYLYYKAAGGGSWTVSAKVDAAPFYLVVSTTSPQVP